MNMLRRYCDASVSASFMLSLTLRSMANVGGLEGCKPSNHASFSRAAEAQPPPHGKKGDSGEASPPQTPPLRKVSYQLLLITPEDVAMAIVFLASKANRQITGETVRVTGGR
jgi:NAD(P)-dependent dehydrogenase (short-subunit alcohol dehydrogenase family)